MNKKGFTLVELLACLALLGAVLGIGLFVTRDTLATALSTLTDISESQIYDASKSYVIEYKINWVGETEEYTCITVNDLVEKGYFDKDEVVSYKDNVIKVVRNKDSKVIDYVRLVDVCE